MKINVYLKLIDGCIIPEKYQHYLSEEIYNFVSDMNYDNLIYSFSHLIGTKRLENGTFVPKDEFVWFEFSSPISSIFNDVIHDIYNKKILINNNLELSHYEYIDEGLEKCVDNYAYFTSLSPITIYNKTPNKIIYYMPHSDNRVNVSHKFDIIYDNLECIKRINSLLIKNLNKCGISINNNDINIELIHSYKPKNYVVKLDNNNNIIRTFGFFGYFKITAHPHILKAISDIGIGNATGLGFGHISRKK